MVHPSHWKRKQGNIEPILECELSGRLRLGIANIENNDSDITGYVGSWKYGTVEVAERVVGVEEFSREDILSALKILA